MKLSLETNVLNHDGDVIVSVDPETGSFRWRDVAPFNPDDTRLYTVDSIYPIGGPQDRFYYFEYLTSPVILNVMDDDTSELVLNTEDTYVFQGGNNDDLFFVTGQYEVESVDGGAGRDALALDLSGLDVSVNWDMNIEGIDEFKTLPSAGALGTVNVRGVEVVWLHLGDGPNALVLSDGDHWLRGGEDVDTITLGVGDVNIETNGGNDIINAGCISGGFIDGGAGDDLIVIDDFTVAKANNGHPESRQNFYLIGGQGDDTVRITLDDNEVNYRYAYTTPKVFNYRLNHNGENIDVTADTDFDALGIDLDTWLQSQDADFTLYLTRAYVGDFSYYARLYSMRANLEDVEILELNGASQNDLMFGMVGNDILNGGAGDDRIHGRLGNDTLIGGEGTDRLFGGLGDDTYIIDANDIVVEEAGQGIDTIVTTASVFTLADNFENLVLESADGAIGNGNEDDNELIGGDGADELYGFGGDDVLDGGAGADLLVGGTGHDTYRVDDVNDVVVELGGEGIDTIETTALDVSLADFDNVENLTFLSEDGATGEGNEEDNTIRGNIGNDFLYGHGGLDTLTGGDGSDALFGGGGNDSLSGGDGGDGLDGGLGNDTLDGGEGVDWLFGREGDDSLTGGNGGDALFGGIGNDTINGEDGDDGIDGGGGNDALYGDAGVDWIVAGDGDDFIDGGADGDAIFGGEGNDTAHGGSGNDGLDGGFGDDILSGGEGVDWLFGGFGNDTIYGSSADLDSDDTDALFGQEGDDNLYGGGGGDSLDGGEGNDNLFGGDGNDFMFGQTGNDVLLGGNGSDVLFGGEDDDELFGGEDGDTLDGGVGNDRLVGGGGIDVLFGGADADTFVFEFLDDSPDIIRDFVSGEDMLELSAAGLGIGTGPGVNTGPDGAVIEEINFKTGAGVPIDFLDPGTPLLYFDTDTKAIWLDLNGGDSFDAINLAGLETGFLTESDISILW